MSEYLEAILNSLGPDEPLTLTADMWSRLHGEISALRAQVAELKRDAERLVKKYDLREAPIEYNNHEASAWLCGYNAAIDAVRCAFLALAGLEQRAPAEPHYLERWMDAQCKAAGFERWFEYEGIVIFERPGEPGFITTFGPVQVIAPSSPPQAADTASNQQAKPESLRPEPAAGGDHVDHDEAERLATFILSRAWHPLYEVHALARAYLDLKGKR